MWNEKDAAAFLVFLIGLGVAFGLLLAFVLPALWHWLKPLLHGLTA